MAGNTHTPHGVTPPPDRIEGLEDPIQRSIKVDGRRVGTLSYVKEDGVATRWHLWIPVIQTDLHFGSADSTFEEVFDELERQIMRIASYCTCAACNDESAPPPSALPTDRTLLRPFEAPNRPLRS